MKNPNIQRAYHMTWTDATDPNDIITREGITVEIAHPEGINGIIKHFIPIDALMACVPLNDMMRPVGDA